MPLAAAAHLWAVSGAGMTFCDVEALRGALRRTAHRTRCRTRCEGRTSAVHAGHRHRHRCWLIKCRSHGQGRDVARGDAAPGAHAGAELSGRAACRPPLRSLVKRPLAGSTSLAILLAEATPWAVGRASRARPMPRGRGGRVGGRGARAAGPGAACKASAATRRAAPAQYLREFPECAQCFAGWPSGHLTRIRIAG